MAFDRTATVLIAEPNGNAKRNEASRNAVAQAVASVADSTGGLVLKTMGGRVMLLFSTPDAAASAASKMHAAVDALPSGGSGKLGVQIGFHTGPAPALKRGNLGDDTIKLALRLVEQAQEGQTLVSRQTVERLNPAFREFSKSVRSPNATADQVPLCEIASWHQKGVRPAGWSAMAVFRLTYRGQLAVCSREKDVVVIGREEDCDLVVDSTVTSRQHCTLRYRDGQVTLRDHSSNGCYVAVKGRERLVKAREVRLPDDEGRIAIGEPSANGGEVVEYCYALVT